MSVYIEDIFPGQTGIIEKAACFAAIESADIAVLCLPENTVDSRYKRNGVLRDKDGNMYKLEVNVSVIIEAFT